jgi:hypothetical protein
MANDNNPRKFYEGKKKANVNSKYGLLSSTMRPSVHEVLRPSSAEKALLGTDKSVLSAELTLFNSLFPQSTDSQRKQFLERAKQEKAGVRSPGAGGGSGGGFDMAGMLMSVKDLRLDQLGLGRRNSHSSGGAAGAGRSAGDTAARAGACVGVAAGVGEQQLRADQDPEVLLWQNFTIDILHKEKTGPKKTLPVLIMKNEGGASSKRYAVNKSKRWGSGTLIQLASEQEEAPISGPSSYLEIYKGVQRRKLPDKDRQRITEELKLLKK